MSPNEVVIYKGVKFRRYPAAETWAERSYFTPGGNHRKRGVGRLHQEIWKDANGPIPDGYVVHHADHNPLNNDPSNLVIELDDDHRRHHSNQPDRVEVSRQNIALARDAARVWHGSEAGREWHAEHGKRTWEGREPKTYACEHCGEAYESIKPSGNRFCSNKCKHYARKASGVDDVDKTCECCGETYRANRYVKTPTCSRSCGMKMARRRTRERKAAGRKPSHTMPLLSPTVGAWLLKQNPRSV